ncbi:MAG: aminotransferase class V-fold PLP-dependent enzyme [Clostridiales bacterium]|jgi:cysteine desulfurase family protein|nr:aminotransferase class V-fold PLP-dependent enzyme [Clostridiales bacterium]
MIYLDNAATTRYKPETVINAAKNALKYLSANPGRAGHSASVKAGMLVYKTRERAAAAFGCADPSRVIFTSGCTAALNSAIFGTAKRGGNVVVTVLEHNSVLRPLFELQRRGVVSVTPVPPNFDGAVTPKMLEQYIDRNTYLLAVTHVSNVTGAVLPLADIGKFARSRGILLLADCAQSAGYREIDMERMNIDMLAVAPHKGLHAAQGVGILALGERADIKPILFGGTGTSGESPFQPSEPPEALESGTLPTPAIAALNAGLRWSEQNRTALAQKLRTLSEFLIDGLDKTDNVTVYTPPAGADGMSAFNVNTLTSGEVCGILDGQYGICARGGMHCAPLAHKHLKTLEKGIVRLSFGWDNTFAEAEFVLQAIREIASSK